MKKDIEWLKKEIGELPCVDTVFNSGGSSYIDSAVPVMAVYDLIDKLDEPEVLSQELPVIPQYVAEYLEFAKSDVPLKRVMEIANTRDEWTAWKKEYDWISSNDETFARAWLDGYEVEEQRYVIKLPMSIDRDMDFALVDYKGDIWVDAYPSKYELTEQEIRALPKGDVYFEYFAEPVEEMEE